jgi:hypothetical protein
MSDIINITVNPDGDEVTIKFDDSAGAAVFAAAAEASAIAAAASETIAMGYKPFWRRGQQKWRRHKPFWRRQTGCIYLRTT